MKKFIIYTISVSVIIAGIVLMNFIPRHNKEETEKFREYKSDFEFITDYVIDNYDCETREIIGVYFENNTVYLYRNDSIPTEAALRKAFLHIRNAYTGDFSYLEVTPERISYGGLGNRMYVYSRNKKVPNYFYHKGDDMDYNCYNFGDNWYLLKYNHR